MNSIQSIKNFKNKPTNKCTKPRQGGGRLCYKSSLTKGTRRSTGSEFPGGQNKKGDCDSTPLRMDLSDSGDFKGHPTSLRLGLICHLALRTERKGSSRAAASPEHQG